MDSWKSNPKLDQIRVVQNKLQSPEYHEKFTDYLANMGTSAGDKILPYLIQSKKSKPSNLEIHVSDIWRNEFTEKVVEGSVMYPELKTRKITTASQERIIQPNLVTSDRRITGGPIRWPGSAPDNTDTYTSSPETQEIVLESGPIEMRIHVAPYIDRIRHLDQIVWTMANDLSRLIDTSVITSVSHFPENPIKNMFDAPNLFDHPSTLDHTNRKYSAGGYIESFGSEVKYINPQVIKDTLWHLPPGYRQRAKWYMSRETAIALEQLQDTNTWDFVTGISRNESWSPFSNQRLLNKPVIFNEAMPDKGIIIILADLTRGYLISHRPENMHIVLTPDSIGLKFDMGGKVLQPAAYKGIKCLHDYEPVEIDPGDIELHDEYDDQGNLLLY